MIEHSSFPGAFMRFDHRVALSTCAIVLAACGGGGGGGSDPKVSVPTGARAGTASAGSDLTAANATGFVGPLARIMIGAADGNVPALGSGRESPTARSASAVSRGTLGFAVASAARTLRGNGLEQALAVTTQTVQCPYGGSITVTANDADNDNELSAGDSASFVFNACVAEFGLPAASGSLAFTVNAVELDANDEPTALDASFTLSGFVENGFGSISGSFRVWFKGEGLSSTRQRVSYLAATVTEGAQTLRYDFDTYGVVGTSSGTFDVVGAVTLGGQTYAVTSDVFSHTLGSLPASGTLSLRDASGDALILRARSSTTFDLEFLPNGASAPTVLATGLAWNSYRLGSN
jgi:hypothetical protein